MPSLGVASARNFCSGFLRSGAAEGSFGSDVQPFREGLFKVSTWSISGGRYLNLGQRRGFRTCSILMGEDQGKPPDRKSGCFSSSSSRFAPGSKKQPETGPCRQPYERTKPCPPPEKCVPPAPPCCRRRPLNTKCPDQPRPPCPPPCPTPCPESPKKPDPPRICYRKCPPPPRLPRLPKCMKPPSPPPAPPLPKLPKLPKCPVPPSPPAAPPPPKCPRPPKCKECPPPRECPPPPPCEPYPCPPPCPPPCCPPPPPCPPCPPPVPCPKPLPCPPPPPPRVCPPCPPCPECPKPEPCPPPPPCCPCPCPKPPPPCPCPKPCPPCPEPSCPKDVPSCPPGRKTTGKGATGSKHSGKRNISTCGISSSSWNLITPQNSISRSLHVSRVSLTDSKDGKTSSCKDLGSICKDTKGNKGTCVKTCEGREPACNRDRAKCPSTRRKEKGQGRQKEEEEEKEECINICGTKGKCDQPATVAPPKMEYGKVECPPPKYISPQPCPPVRERRRRDVRAVKQKKEICPPVPLPKPPTEPVVLCPCLPPSKMHPGPCPCYDIKEDPVPPLMMPPCPVKEKYPCPREPHYCPQETKVCQRRRQPCEHRKKKKPEE